MRSVTVGNEQPLRRPVTVPPCEQERQCTRPAIARSPTHGATSRADDKTANQVPHLPSVARSVQLPWKPRDPGRAVRLLKKWK
jgi:hypothetical protein